MLYQSASNLFILHMWGKASAPWLQALHFSWGIGSFLAPLLVRPYILPLESDMISYNETGALNFTINERSAFKWSADDLLIQWPFLYVSCYTLLGALMYFFFVLKHRDTPAHPSRVAALAEEKATRDG